MSGRALAAGWIVTAVVFGALLVWELETWRALDARRREAGLTRTQLSATIKTKQEEVLREIRSQGSVGEMQWSMERADPAVFLNGLAEIARGTRLKILAIGPLEHTTTPQLVKSWQTVQVTAPFADLKDLVARIERDRGLLEDMVLEIVRDPARPREPETREIQARFKMTSIEVTGDAEVALQRVLAANRGPGRPPSGETVAALPLPMKSTDHAGRDPFAFVGPGVAAAPKKKPAATAPVARRPPSRGTAPGATEEFGDIAATPPDQSRSTASAPMDVRGIISLPDGFLAIVNNEIVRAGDMVDNHRVEKITATTILLRRKDGESRLLTLPATMGPPSDGVNR